MTNCNAVLDDPVSWRHGKVPDYTAANSNYLRGKPPAASLSPPPSPAPAQPPGQIRAKIELCCLRMSSSGQFLGYNYLSYSRKEMAVLAN